MWQTKRNSGRVVRGRGFTMVELLLVLVILATLAAVVLPKYSGRSEDAKIAACKQEISNLETALDAFEIDNGYYPQGDDGLYDLTDEPSDAPNWKGPYMKKLVELDPWGNPYIYLCPGEYNPSSYDITSMGGDGQNNTADDLANWMTREDEMLNR